MNIKELIQKLEQGIVPDELDYTKPEEKKDSLDWSKVAYNTFYKSPEFFARRFPDGMLSLPGFDKVLQEMADNAKDPMEEMLERQQISSDKLDNGLVSTSPELQECRQDDQ